MGQPSRTERKLKNRNKAMQRLADDRAKMLHFAQQFRAAYLESQRQCEELRADNLRLRSLLNGKAVDGQQQGTDDTQEMQLQERVPGQAVWSGGEGLHHGQDAEMHELRKGGGH